MTEMTHKYCFMIRGGGFEGFGNLIVWMGSQSELHLGALSVLFMARFLTWMAACSVRFRWDWERWSRDFRRLMLFLAILCPVVREW